MTATEMVQWVSDAALVVLAVSLLLVFARFLLGPGLEDRVAAIDLMSTILVSAAAVYAVRHGAAVLLDVAVVVALVSFIGTVAFAYHLARGSAS